MATAPVGTYWSTDAETLLRDLHSASTGLSTADAARRLAEGGSGALRPAREFSALRVFLRQFKSPLLLLLVFAAALSVGTGEWSDALIVLVIVGATVGISYAREYRAERAAGALRADLRTTCTVLRDGRAVSVPREDVVPGDVVQLSAGHLVPADARVIEAADCFVSEAVLTGESYPVEKRPDVLAAETGLAGRSNCLFLGTSVRSGSATGLVVATGLDTELGAIANRLAQPAADTDFDRGLRRFGYLLTSAMFIIVLTVFAVHMLNHRPVIETLLFSVALAVGLSPELLPAILSVNLARGAQMMATRGVLVRHLNAIENLGSMDVLCTDKTGTLTEGVVQLAGAFDAAGLPSSGVLRDAVINAAFHTGRANPLDQALLDGPAHGIDDVQKLAEIPFDSSRKRISVVAQHGADARMITKGAIRTVLPLCDRQQDGRPLDDVTRAAIQARADAWSRDGVRVVAVATRAIEIRASYTHEDESGLAFSGFITFLDRPKEGVSQALQDLARLGVSVKIITGDNHLVTTHLAGLVGLPAERVLTGAQLAGLPNAASWRFADEIDLFVEVDAAQKERIIRALRQAGHVVGFLGDGVNDAPAMHAADTSLSVKEAVDVAREAADFVLLERDLDVIRGGIEEGRRTFANTLKYILTTTSANLGNMISMAAASLMLPFLPLTAGQILLNNLLSDVPAIGIADDSVDPELVRRPPRWDMRFIGRFMTEFGVLSSLFDFVTFGLLLWIFAAGIDLFRTGWFVESLLTELAIALVVRTRRPFFRSRPGTVLLASTVALIGIACLVPVLPLASTFGFVPLPASMLLALGGVVGAYVGAAELLKVRFYRRAAAPS